jgi:hypothetical protein
MHKETGWMCTDNTYTDTLLRFFAVEGWPAVGSGIFMTVEECVLA